MTTDLDLLIQLEKNNVALFISAMEELCYKPEVPVSAEDFKDPDKRRCWREDKGMEVFSFFHTDKPLRLVDVFTRNQLTWGRLMLRKRL